MKKLIKYIRVNEDTWIEADRLNEFYPSRIKGNAKQLSDSKRVSDKMPVSESEGPDEHSPEAIF